MSPTYVLARDHLQRAAAILQGSESRTRQLRYIIERTIVLMDEAREDPPVLDSNVLPFSTSRGSRASLD